MKYAKYFLCTIAINMSLCDVQAMQGGASKFLIPKSRRMYVREVLAGLPCVRSLPIIRNTPSAQSKRLSNLWCKRDIHLETILFEHLKNGTPLFYTALKHYYMQRKFPFLDAFTEFKELYKKSREMYDLAQALHTSDIDTDIASDAQQIIDTLNEEYFNLLQTALIAIKDHESFYREINAMATQDIARNSKAAADAAEWNAMANTINAFKHR